MTALIEADAIRAASDDILTGMEEVPVRL